MTASNSTTKSTLRSTANVAHLYGRAGGLTLVELLIVMAVAAALIATAVPAFQWIIMGDRSLAQATSLLVSLNTARSEAIKQDLPGGVTICPGPAADGISCNSTANWAQGWMVRNPQGGIPVSVVPALGGGNVLSVSPNVTQLTFYSDGSVSNAVAFTLCDSRGASYARYTQVSQMGRVAASNSVGHDLANAPLTCPQ